MTKEELLALLRYCKGGEEGHQEAESALLEYLADPEITEAYNRIPNMWYS
jgi:hypothetical protein